MRAKAAIKTLTVIGAEVFVLVVLLSIGPDLYRANLWDWLTAAEPLVAVQALLRAVAIVIAVYLLATTVLTVVASTSSRDGLTTFAQRVTLPIITRALAVSITVGSATAPLMTTAPVAAETIALVIETSSEADVDNALNQVSDLPAPVEDDGGTPFDSDDADFWLPDNRSDPVPDDGTAAERVVIKGDHFWSIAQDVVTQATGQHPTENEICQYWVRLVDANRARIRSGDVDLIYPGEVIAIPDLFTTTPEQ